VRLRSARGAGSHRESFGSMCLKSICALRNLRKHGLRLRLPSQSFQVLALLLEHPGELVTREELREKLWPADTFVDFDHGMNAAVNRLASPRLAWQISTRAKRRSSLSACRSVLR